MFSVSVFILFQLQLKQWKTVTLIHLFPLATPLKDSALQKLRENKENLLNSDVKFFFWLGLFQKKTHGMALGCKCFNESSL